jgi:hypothetical protein
VEDKGKLVVPGPWQFYKKKPLDINPKPSFVGSAYTVEGKILGVCVVSLEANGLLIAQAPALRQMLAGTILKCYVGLIEYDTHENIFEGFKAPLAVIAASLGCEVEEVTLEVLRALAGVKGEEEKTKH